MKIQNLCYDSHAQEMKWNGWRLKFFYTIGAIVWIFSGVGIFFLPSKTQNVMYLLSITTGIANALMTVRLSPFFLPLPSSVCHPRDHAP